MAEPRRSCRPQGCAGRAGVYTRVGVSTIDVAARASAVKRKTRVGRPSTACGVVCSGCLLAGRTCVGCGLRGQALEVISTITRGSLTVRASSSIAAFRGGVARTRRDPLICKDARPYPGDVAVTLSRRSLGQWVGPKRRRKDDLDVTVSAMWRTADDTPIRAVRRGDRRHLRHAA